MRRESIEEYKAKQRKEAVCGVAFFAVIQVMTMIAFGSLCFIPDAPKGLVILFAVLAGICVLPLLMAIRVLKLRFAEIEGGEAYDARQY